MQINKKNLAALVELRAPAAGETPPSPAERDMAIAAGTFDDCLLIGDLPLSAQLLLRIVAAGPSIGRAALAERAYPNPRIGSAVDLLVWHRLVTRLKNGMSYKITSAGAALVAAATAPKPTPPRTFARAGAYEGRELHNNSLRPGAYVAMGLPSHGACRKERISRASQQPSCQSN